MPKASTTAIGNTTDSDQVLQVLEMGYEGT